MAVSFSDTQIAFSHVKDWELECSYWLFSLLHYKSLVKSGKLATALALKLHLPIRFFLKKTIFRQFCGGENLRECEKKVKRLAEYNVGTILDYAAESAESENAFESVTREILATIEVASGNKNIPFCVFKMTGIARMKLLEKQNDGTNLSPKERKEWDKVLLRIKKICDAASMAKVPILVDAEHSWIQSCIDKTVQEMMKIYNKQSALVYNTLQMYRTDRWDYLQKIADEAQKERYLLGIKLVRGAYMEKERDRSLRNSCSSPIHKTKEDTDRAYDQAMEFIVRHSDRISLCAGTHNEESCLYLIKLMEECKIANDDKRFYFAQLLGMSDHISFNLANAGYNVVKYVPYGPVKKVIPYLIRRAEENTAILGQTGRELRLIIQEKQRRRRR